MGGIGAMGVFARLIRDEKGASAVEYGLIVALIVVAMIAGLNKFADTTIGMWTNVSEDVRAVI